jgi:hypothetical protein
LGRYWDIYEDWMISRLIGSLIDYLLFGHGELSKNPRLRGETRMRSRREGYVNPLILYCPINYFVSIGARD